MAIGSPVNAYQNLANAYRSTTPSNSSATQSGNNGKQTSTSNLQTGQQVPGLVQSKQANGMFKVQVAGQNLQMRLPENTQVGSNIRLSVIAASPQVSFSVLSSQTPLATPQQIGATARLLANLAEQPLERQALQQLNKQPIWPSTDKAPASKDLASALRNALVNSGLFYESHQAQWIRGERSISQLLQEPQNRLTRNIKATLEHQHGIPKDLLPLVQQQLNTLENNQLNWHGFAWPGQPMEWEVSEHTSSKQQAKEEHQWQTEMSLDLPALGNVTAKLTMSQQHMQISLQTDNDATHQKFNKHLETLRNNLDQAGISNPSISIKQK